MTIFILGQALGSLNAEFFRDRILIALITKTGLDVHHQWGAVSVVEGELS